MASYSDQVLAVKCADCGAEAGVACKMWSAIRGREITMREPHGKRVKFAKHRARWGSRGSSPVRAERSTKGAPEGASKEPVMANKKGSTKAADTKASDPGIAELEAEVAKQGKEFNFEGKDGESGEHSVSKKGSKPAGEKPAKGKKASGRVTKQHGKAVDVVLSIRGEGKKLELVATFDGGEGNKDVVLATFPSIDRAMRRAKGWSRRAKRRVPKSIGHPVKSTTLPKVEGEAA